MKAALLIALIFFCSADPIELNDQNFQRKTLIGKHIPIANWVIAFCTDVC